MGINDIHSRVQCSTVGDGSTPSFCLTPTRRTLQVTVEQKMSSVIILGFFGGINTLRILRKLLKKVHHSTSWCTLREALKQEGIHEPQTYLQTLQEFVVATWPSASDKRLFFSVHTLELGKKFLFPFLLEQVDFNLLLPSLLREFLYAAGNAVQLRLVKRAI